MGAVHSARLVPGETCVSRPRSAGQTRARVRLRGQRPAAAGGDLPPVWRSVPWLCARAALAAAALLPGSSEPLMPPLMPRHSEGCWVRWHSCAPGADSEEVLLRRVSLRVCRWAREVLGPVLLPSTLKG